MSLKRHIGTEYRIRESRTIPRPFGHVVIVDIFGLVNKVESLTGEKLRYLRIRQSMGSPIKERP